MAEELARLELAEAADDAVGRAKPPSPRRSGSRLVLIIAVAAVAIAAAAGLIFGGGGLDRPRGGSTADPTATLDAALAAGTPVYILIHSRN